MEAFKILLKDPVGGLAKAFSLFDSGRAQMVGLIFGVVYALAATIAAGILFSAFMGAFMGGGLSGVGFGSPPFSMYVKYFVAYVGEVAGVIAGCLLVRTIFKGAGSLASDIYMSGAALLPMGVGLLAGSLLSYVHIGLFAILVIFGGSYFVLMLYAGCQQILKLPESKSAFSVPVVITAGVIALGILLKVMM